MKVLQMSRIQCPGYVLIISSMVFSTAPAWAGPFAPAGGDPSSPAINIDDPGIVLWANDSSTVSRGLVKIDNPALGYASFGGPDGSTLSDPQWGPWNTVNSAPVGKPSYGPDYGYGVALGQGGSAVLKFDRPITDGPGADFAVFGTAFQAGWIKPAFVEVSSDGQNFVRFPAVSLTQTSTQLGSFDMMDPTNLNNLAGKDPMNWGTPFDLSQLAGTSGLDIHNITQVRVVDCVGDIDPNYATHDSLGNIINGPWPQESSYGAFGFVLAGVGVVNAVPEPSSMALLLAGVAVGGYWRMRRGSSRR
jgi:hypothetical protein